MIINVEKKILQGLKILEEDLLVNIGWPLLVEVYTGDSEITLEIDMKRYTTKHKENQSITHVKLFRIFETIKTKGTTIGPNLLVITSNKKHVIDIIDKLIEKYDNASMRINDTLLYSKEKVNIV